MAEIHPGYVAMLTMLGTMVIVGLGVLLNNSRLSDLRVLIESNHANLKSLIDGNHANVRSAIQDLRVTMDARFAEQKAELLRVEQVMDARLRHLEEHL